jgi:NAD(P)-dependent dehydrogenase (short-subunit alcohol dehydrogenase family)
MKLLEGAFAIVTGGASPRGLGFATAELMSEQGATVAILDLDGAASQAAARAIGAQHVGLACDVRDKAACHAAAETLSARWGRIDVLVNNAGVTHPVKVMDITPEKYDAVMDVCLRGTLNMSQAAIPQMRAQKAGAIVNISSVAGQRGGGIFGGPHYAAAKAGILGLTKAMARELAPDGIRVNAVSPGYVPSDLTAGQLTDEMQKQILAGIPMGRAGAPRDVAGCCLFLASSLSAFVTGSVVDVNGGSHIH